MSASSQIGVALDTSLGRIDLVLYPDRAPRSVARFLLLVDDGTFTQRGAFYRTVRRGENDHGEPPIDIVQCGLREPPPGLQGIEHESTRDTGLRHVDGTVSLARAIPGTATGAAFFICIGDQAALDEGGRRARDGRGFAAFGRVTEGMETIRAIHRLEAAGVATDACQAGQLLDPTVRIRAFRKK